MLILNGARECGIRCRLRCIQLAPIEKAARFWRARFCNPHVPCLTERRFVPPGSELYSKTLRRLRNRPAYIDSIVLLSHDEDVYALRVKEYKSKT